MIFRNYKENLAYLKEEFQELKKVDSGGQFYASFMDSQNRPVVVVNASDLASLEKLMLTLATDGAMDPENPIHIIR